MTRAHLAVARSPAASWRQAAAALRLLASDSRPAVRSAAAGNPSCAARLLDRLVNDRAAAVLAHLAGNRSAPPETLREAALDAWGGTFTETLSKNPKCPFGLLERLAFSTRMHKEPCDQDECRWADSGDRAAVLAGVLPNPGSCGVVVGRDVSLVHSCWSACSPCLASATSQGRLAARIAGAVVVRPRPEL